MSFFDAHPNVIVPTNKEGNNTASHKIIAIGKSTQKKLMEFGIENCILPISFDEVGLAEAVFGL